MTKRLPVVGIGMPVYNGGRFLPVALDSLLAQTFEDFELVISDNASTDDTETVCREYAAADERIRYIRQPRNLGANPNFNAVRRLARGSFFKWASANDVCEPTFIAECVDVLKARPDVVLCYPQTRLIDDDDGFIDDYDDPLDASAQDPVSRFLSVIEDMGLNNAFNGVVRAPALDSVGDLATYFGSDRPLMAALALRGRFHRVPDALFHRRMGPASHTTIRRKKGDARDYHFDEGQLLLKQHIEYFDIVRRSPISLSLKVRLVGALLRRLSWHRRRLAAEAIHALKARRETS